MTSTSNATSATKTTRATPTLTPGCKLIIELECYDGSYVRRKARDLTGDADGAEGMRVTERRHGLARIQVAATLRRMREQAGVPRDAAAGSCTATVSKIGDIETGRSGIKPAELRSCSTSTGDRGGPGAADRDRRTSGPAAGATPPARASRPAAAATSIWRPRPARWSSSPPSCCPASAERRLRTGAAGVVRPADPAEIDWRLALRAERRKASPAPSPRRRHAGASREAALRAGWAAPR